MFCNSYVTRTAFTTHEVKPALQQPGCCRLQNVFAESKD